MTTTTDLTIHPFEVRMPEEDLADLRRRIAATRLPSRELVADRSQGVQLATITELARYWATDYDWRACEARLNALPQFKTEIDGVDVHFIHVKSRHENALPLIMTHGWPGSVIELLETVGPLTDPAAHGGSAGDAFDLVLPSIPGYGFSGEPAEIGWHSGRVAQAWPELMRRLGYTRYVAQGGDQGAAVTDAMGRQAPAGLAGIHMNLLVTALGGGPMPADTEVERAALEQISDSRTIPSVWSGVWWGVQSRGLSGVCGELWHCSVSAVLRRCAAEGPRLERSLRSPVVWTATRPCSRALGTARGRCSPPSACMGPSPASRCPEW